MALAQINAGNRTSGYRNGFVLLGDMQSSGIIYWPVKASVTIAKGDLLGDDGSGFAQLETAFATTTIGVAVEPVASQTSDGDADVGCIPVADSTNRWIVPIENDSVLDAANRGDVIDIETEDGLDTTDTTIVAYGFLIEEIDISTAAIAVNTYGYAIGRFVAQER